MMPTALHRAIVTLLLVTAVAVGTAGCILVPFPVFDHHGGHHEHHR